MTITIRNFDLPPGMTGMLILDSRLGERAVRRLMGDELCSIMEIQARDVDWLLDRASELTAGKYAGNSIPRSMAQPEVAVVVSMLTAADDRAAYAGRTGLPVIHSRAPAVPARLTKLVLIPVNCDLRQAWLPELADCVWGMVMETEATQASARSIATEWVASWARQHSHTGELRVELAAEWNVGLINTKVLVWPSTLPPQTSNALSVSDFRQGGSEMLKAMVAPALVKAGMMNGTPIYAAVLSECYSWFGFSESTEAAH